MSNDDDSANSDTQPAPHHRPPSTDHGPVVASHAAAQTRDHPLVHHAIDHKKKKVARK